MTRLILVAQWVVLGASLIALLPAAGYLLALAAMSIGFNGSFGIVVGLSAAAVVLVVYAGSTLALKTRSIRAAMAYVGALMAVPLLNFAVVEAAAGGGRPLLLIEHGVLWGSLYWFLPGIVVITHLIRLLVAPEYRTR